MNFATDVAEPAEDIRGDIARTYFYMLETYGFPVGHELLEQLSFWAVADPVSPEELARARRVEAVQGNRNQYVVGATKACGPSPTLGVNRDEDRDRREDEAG